jgi:hypothetical protein
MLAKEQETSRENWSGKGVFIIYERLNAVNQHKMIPIPVLK